MPRGTYATQGKELNWNLSFTEWPLSVLCWRQFWRDDSACSSARQAWTIFSVLPPPPPPQKKNKKNNNNNTKTTGVGRIVELYSRLINPTNRFPAFDFPAASFRLEVTSASSSRLLPRTSGDSSVDRHLLVQRRLRSSTSLLASATTPVSPA